MRESGSMKGKMVRVLVFGVVFCFVGACVTPNILTRIAKADSTLLWSDNFDDGDISDWTIENPGGGGTAYYPVVVELSNSQYMSSPYSLRVDRGSYDPYYSGAYVIGPYVSIDNTKPYTIEFDFRWDDFHWFFMVEFQHVRLVPDCPD
ncbi:MAG TPA: hypothetical protein ENI42_04065, partial [Thermoplasmatales archaeon]|nr:hypothetical protein [Thermoplasmatales archaeon]